MLQTLLDAEKLLDMKANNYSNPEDNFKTYTFGQNSGNLGLLHQFAPCLLAYLVFKLQFHC